MLVVADEFFKMFKYFLRKVDNELSKSVSIKFRETYQYKKASEREDKIYKGEGIFIDEDGFKKIAEDILDKFNLQKSRIYPLSNLDEPEVDKESHHYRFSVEIGDITDHKLFRLLFADEDYSEYRNRIEDSYHHIEFDQVTLEQRVSQGRNYLDFEYYLIRRVRFREKDDYGKFKSTPTSIETRRIRVDADLYNVLARIKNRLAETDIKLTEKQILNLILAEELICYTEDDFANLMEQMNYLLAKWR